MVGIIICLTLLQSALSAPEETTDALRCPVLQNRLVVLYWLDQHLPHN